MKKNGKNKFYLTNSAMQIQQTPTEKILLQLENYKLIEGPLKIESIKVLSGANYFSGDKVIRFRLNLGEYDEVFTNKIDGFFEYMSANVPSLHEHHCSVGKVGGFYQRVKEGTLLGHVMEHITIELQHLSGMQVAFGKTRMTKIQGVYNVLFRFVDESAGIYAGKAAFNFINAFFTKQPFDIKKIIENLIFIREKKLLGPSTQSIVNEAHERNIPVIRHDKYNLVQLGTGKYRKLIRATVTDETNLIAVEMVENKFRTTSILDEAGIPVPETIKSTEISDIIAFKNERNKEIVIKPAFGNRGRGVNIGLSTDENIKKAFEQALTVDHEVIAQEDIPGMSFRLLVINFKFVAAVRLVPPSITGNGTDTIKTLIDKLNNEPEREFGDKGKLSKVRVDDNTLKIIEFEGYTLESVLPESEIIYLKNSGNMQLGASSIDVTDKVHPINRFVVERACKVLNLNVAGVDVVTPDISVPFIENNGKLIEVNAAPDFRIHFNPTKGQAQKVQKQFVEMLFGEDAPSRIPVYSVTGSQGKNLAVRLIDYGLKSIGRTTGTVNSDGFYIDGKCLKNKDATDVKNVMAVLKDPSIDVAIVETPVETILESGLGYEYADFGIVLNLSDNKEEYYSYDHIRNIEDVAYAKSVVAEMVYDEGYTILNADEELVFDMESRIYSKLALFSRRKSNPKIKRLVKDGGVAVILDEMNIFIFIDGKSNFVANAGQIAALDESFASHELEAVMAATAAMYLSGLGIKEIQKILLKVK